MARYMDGSASADAILEQMNGWLADPTLGANKTLQVLASSIYSLEDNINEAYRVLGEGRGIEQLAMLVQLHLKIHRADLAANVVKQMKSLDEDGALTMLATAWVNISLSPSKAQDAVYIFEELIDKYNSSTMLLNGLAVAKMHLGYFEEAEVALKEAINKVGRLSLRPSRIALTPLLLTAFIIY